MPKTERHVRLFRNGRNQSVRTPREFQLERHEAILCKAGDRRVPKPACTGRLPTLPAALEPLEGRFPDADEGLAPLDDAER